MVWWQRCIFAKGGLEKVHDQGGLRLEQAGRRLGLLLLLLVHLEVLGADLLDDEVERVLELADRLAGARELADRGVLVRQAAPVGLDNVEVGLGVEGLAQLDSQVDVGLLLHEDVSKAGLPLSIFLILGLAAGDEL